jgi:hypothetical protein
VVVVGITLKMLALTLSIQSCVVVASAIFLEMVNLAFLHKEHSKKIATPS